MAYLPVPSGAQDDVQVSTESQPFYRRHLLALVGFFVVMAFLAAPWPFEVKAHAAMHGLCAQTPSHTFYFDGRPLPFDGRMTGIYSGVLASVLILVVFGRHRAAGLPSLGAGLVLLLFLGAMAVDGFNSLLTDLGIWHPYAPSNELRLLTGWMAGIGIGTVMVMLAGMTLWRSPRLKMSVLPSWWWPFVLLAPIVPMRLLIGTGSSVVYFPYSVLLMASAVTAFAILALCTLLMLRNQENGYDRFAQARPAAALSVLIAIGIIAAISAGRFWLEAITGVAAVG